MDFKIPIACISIIFSITSCSSIRELKKNAGEGVMYGMVYNGENVPVSNAEVFVDEKSITQTDTQGRFILISKQHKEFALSIVKSGYETIAGKFQFEPMDVIHLVMLNAEQLVHRAENAMTEGRYHDVIIFCDRALVLNLDRIDAIYLKALGLVRLREYGRARTILEELQDIIGEREYIRLVLEGLPK